MTDPHARNVGVAAGALVSAVDGADSQHGAVVKVLNDRAFTFVVPIADPQLRAAAETVATGSTVDFHWGGIFCDREAARFRVVARAAADTLRGVIAS